MNIIEQGTVTDGDIGELRKAVGWDHNPGVYDHVLKGVQTYFIARNEDNKLIGFVSVISDNVADAMLVDLIVHPDYQSKGLGRKLVQACSRYAKEKHIQCLHVTFDPSLQDFYRKCGFHITGGGIIDFKTMNVDV